jgi:outer membrane protein TolC
MRTPFFLVAFSLVAADVASQPPPVFTLQTAIDEALKGHPDVVAAERRHDAARQRPAQARSLPDPMVSAGWTSVGNPLPGAGLGTEPLANLGVMVSQELPYPGKRDARAAVSTREADAAFHEIAAARLGVTSRVKQAYYGLAYTYAAASVLERSRELLATLVKVSEQRYAVGQAAQQDVIKAQTQLSVLELQQRRLQRALREREGELNAAMGRPAGTAIGRPQELESTTFAEPLDALVTRAEANAPMLKRDQLMIESARLAVDAARLDYKPDFAISGGYGYQGSMPAMYEFRFDVTIPLQRDRRAAAVSEQVSLAAAAEQAYRRSQLSLHERLHHDFETATTASSLAALYRDTVLPQARLALESSMASYQTGAVDFLSVLTNFSMVLEYEMTYFEELTTLHQAISRLEEMTGVPIPH